jgi:3-dehydroquinate dehydratase
VSLLEELARDQHACPVCDIAELRVDVWASDEELDELLADWRASRDTSLS